MSPTQLIALLGLLASSAIASMDLKIAAPTPRSRDSPNPLGWTPKPTTSPRLRYPPGLDILRRQDLEKTCGYVNGELSSSITCPTGYCAFDSVSQAFGCCTSVVFNTALNSVQPDANCGFEQTTQCYGSGYSLSRVPTGTLSCSDSAAPFCVLFTLVIPGYSGYEALGCSTTGGTYTVYTTYTDTSSATPVPLPITSPSVISTPSPPPSTLPVTSPTPTPGAIGGGGGGSSSNTGAIAGGAVGGVLGLAAIGGLIWFLLRRNKRNKSTGPHVNQTQQGPPVQDQRDYNSPGGMAQVQSPQYTGASTMQPQYTGVSDMHSSTMYGSSISGAQSDYDKSPRPTSYQVSSPGTSELYAPLPGSTEVRQGAWSGEKSYTSYQSGPVSDQLHEVDGSQAAARPHELDAANQSPGRSELRG